MKLRAEPYTLELRHDIKDSEQGLRGKLNLEWCDGVLFNVTVKKNIDIAEYDFIIVVKNLEKSSEKKKGKAHVISLDEITNYLFEFESTLDELDYVEKLLKKYVQSENPVEFSREIVLNELKKLRDKIEQVNK